MKDFVRKYIKESWIFWVLLILNLLPAILYKFNLTLDGAAHLHNANIIRNLLTGDPHGFSEFYSLNTIPVPNSASHYIMALIGLAFNGYSTEKIFVILYLIFLALSFRYMVLSFSKESPYLTWLVFPFAYSLLFLCGFYNFLISLIFAFYAIGYWKRTMDAAGARKYIVLTVLLTATYFSNMMNLMLALAFIISISFFSSLRETTSFKTFMRAFGKKSVVFFICSIPSVVCAIIFLSAVHIKGSDYSASDKELIQSVFEVRPLITYTGEFAKYTVYFSYLYIILFTAALFFRVEKFRNSDRTERKFTDLFRLQDVLLLAAICIGFLYFKVPDGASVGMMTPRLSMIMFLLFIAWIASNYIPKWIGLTCVIIYLLIAKPLLEVKHEMPKDLSRLAKEVYYSSRKIQPGSTLLPVNFWDDWLTAHTGSYTGIDKPVIVLENYEAVLPWFPVRVNMEKMPKTVLGNKTSLKSVSWITNSGATKERKIDYVLVYGNLGRLNDSNYVDLKQELDSNFIPVYETESNQVKLWERKDLPKRK